MDTQGPFISLSPSEVRRLAGVVLADDDALALAADTLLAGDEVWVVVRRWAQDIARLAEQGSGGTPDA